MSTIRVAIAGATGYTGEELIRLLVHHPHVQVSYLAGSAKWERPVPVSHVFPRVGGRLSLAVEALDPARLLSSSDLIFLALPHGAAMALVPQLLAAGKRVIDLSGDFRLRDPSAYPTWYNFEHANPALLSDSRIVYGLTEFHRAEIQKAQVISNPGCYATSVLLALLPLFQAKLVAPGAVIVDAKSGLSGAGRKADESLLFTEMTENLRAYKVNHHQHMPEMLQEIQRVSGQAAAMMFVPQLIPVSRGLISMLYVKTTAGGDAVWQAYQRCYGQNTTPFIRLHQGSLPQLRDVIETNYCDIGVVYDEGQHTAIIGSALDNLTKGAAGQAVQNFNLMYGFPETTGLL